MAATLKDFLAWCRRHIVLVTVVFFVLVVAFGFVNIQILHMTSEPEFCAMCHPKKGFGPLAEVDSWEHSGHAEAGVSCLDCHGRPGPVGYARAKLGGLKDLYMQFTISKEEKLEILRNPEADLVPDEHCLFCHSDEGNREYREKHAGPMEIIDMRLLDKVKNPEFRERKGLPDILEDTFVGGTHFDHAFHMENFDFSCRDCHFGVVHRPGTKTEKMNFCVNCHQDFAGSSAPLIEECGACHEAQLAMNEGEGALEVSGDPSLMYGIGITCQMCHTGVEEGVYRPSSSTCTDCHDESYKQVFQMWEEEIAGQLERLSLMRAEVEGELKEAEEIGRNVDPLWERYEKALFNLNFVEDDGTKGIHNNDYASSILDAVETEFEAIRKELKEEW